MLRRRQQAGFTLVEVMVTVFVVAIGLLAAAGLQAVAKKAAIDAMQRSTASVLAQDMLERIRANPGEITRYASKGASLTAAPTPTTQCNSTTTCTQEQLVDYDLQTWWQSLDGAEEKISNGDGGTSSAGGLRSPVGCIRFTADQVVEVVIAWRGLSRIDQQAENSRDPVGDPCGTTVPNDPFEQSGTASFRRVLRLQGHIQTL